MRRLSVSTLVSLDSVVQDPGGFGETEQGGWANAYFGPEMQAESVRHLQASDYFLVGRRTFELLYDAWGANTEGPYAQRMSEIPKLVASTTLSGPLGWNATAIDGDVPKAIAAIKAEDGGGIEVYGSPTLVQTLLRHDLVDEIRVSLHPLVLGSGKTLFPQPALPVALRLEDVRRLESGAVNLTYVPERGAA